MGNMSIWQLAAVTALGWMLLSAFGSRRGSSQTYVIKEWFASETPNEDGIFVHITGRKGGLMSFLMSLVGIDPTVSLVVDNENVRFRRGSWTGYSSWVTPLDKLCSGQYGYSKPFWSTSIWAIIGVALLLPSSGFSLILILGAVTYYFLNKTLVLGLTFVGGANVYSGDALAFRRSVIEGENIDELATARIVAIIEMIVRGADKPRALTVDAGVRATASETLNRAAGELATVADHARQRTEAFAAQARQTGARAAAKVSSSLAGSSAALPPSGDQEMTKCPNCDGVVSPENIYCVGCGHKLK